MPDVSSERRQFLVHLESSLIKQVKILALQRGTTASALVQQALTQFVQLPTDRGLLTPLQAIPFASSRSPAGEDLVAPARRSARAKERQG